MHQAGKTDAAWRGKKANTWLERSTPLAISPSMARNRSTSTTRTAARMGGVSPPEQGLVPGGVQPVVEQEQQEHPSSRPLVGHIAPQLVAHEEQQGQGHQGVHGDFQFAFHPCAHRPRPSIQAATSSPAPSTLSPFTCNPSRMGGAGGRFPTAGPGCGQSRCRRWCRRAPGSCRSSHRPPRRSRPPWGASLHQSG